MWKWSKSNSSITASSLCCCLKNHSKPHGAQKKTTCFIFFYACRVICVAARSPCLPVSRWAGRLWPAGALSWAGFWVSLQSQAERGHGGRHFRRVVGAQVSPRACTRSSQSSSSWSASCWWSFSLGLFLCLSCETSGQTKAVHWTGKKIILPLPYITSGGF